MRKQLLKRFRYSVRERGRADYELGLVRDVVISHGHVTGIVADAEDQRVEIYFEDDPFVEDPQLASKCDCTRVEGKGPCHHQWALIEHCQKEGILRRLKEEYVPSALWRSRLEQLERAGRKREVSPWVEVGEVQGRVRYLFDVSLSLQSEYLYLTSEWQKKSRNGGWSQAKRLANDSFTRSRVGDETDRRIAALLRPFDVPESIEFSAARRLGRARLPAAAMENVMRLVCSTGRVFATSNARVSDEPLRWDDEGPWKIVPRIERQGLRLLFDYVLRRGGEELELTSEMFLIGSSTFHSGGVLFTGRAFLTVASSPPWHVLESVLLGGPIEVPSKEEARLFEATAAFTDECELRATELIVEAPVAPLALLEVTIEPEEVQAEEQADEAHACTIRFAYGERIVAAEDTSRVLPHGPGGRPVRRAREVELQALRRFLEVGGALEQVSEHAEPQPRIPRKALHRVVGALGAEGWQVRLSGAEIRSSAKTNFRVTSGIDWFDVAGSMDFAGELVALPAVLAATKRGEHFVELKDGSLGLLPAEGSQQWKLIERLGRAQGDAIRFTKNQGWLLDALLASREAELEVDAGFVALRERLLEVGSAGARREEPSFVGELRGYQREGLGWVGALHELGLGGILADDMGLGKTVQVLAELESRRLDPALTHPSIVVAPKSLVFNWAREAQRFAPELRVLTYGGPERALLLDDLAGADLVITTYGTLRRDITILSEVPFDYAILDEAQAIKNSSSQVSKAVRLLRADHRLALSGTPIENHLGELWSIFEFLNPGMLGRSTNFKRLFAGKRLDRLDDEQRARVARALRPFILRRTKEEVLPDLPEKSEQTIYCDLTHAQRKDYDELRDYYRASLLESRDPASSLPKIHVLEALLRLRQASCHPGLLDPERMDEPSAKFELLLPMLEELREEGHKALVFSQFTQHLAALRQLLDGRKIEYAYLDGRTRKREEQIDRFQEDPTCSLFLISLKAGGHGLNLTAADYVFLLDPWWNPAAESQAIDRSHRIGQTKKVMAYRLISRDTAEEKVLELQERKRELARAILSRDSAVLRDMTREDLELLLS
jgi:hypothetical protein